VHIFFDDAEYSKNNLFNRNKIKTANGWQWLTIPVNYKSDNLINETKIDNTIDWQKKHWKTICLNYGQAKKFQSLAGTFNKFYQKDWKYLADLTIEMNTAICQMLKIKTKLIKSSKLKVIGKGNVKLINLCKKVKANTYLSGQGAKIYMDDAMFQRYNIKVKYQQFKSLIYQQLWGDFIPDLSIIDYLFNQGIPKFNNH